MFPAKEKDSRSRRKDAPRGRGLQSLQKFLKMGTYKNFLLKNKTKPVRLPWLLYTKLQDRSRKNRVLWVPQRKPGVRWPEAERLSPQSKARSRRRKIREAAFPGVTAREAEAPAPRILRPARREAPASRPAPAPRLPLTAAKLASWPGSRSLPAATAGLLGPAARAAAAWPALCYHLPPLPGAGRRPASTGSRAKGVTVSGRGAPEHRSANSAESASWLPPRLPPARGGPSMELVAPESTQLCAARLGPSLQRAQEGVLVWECRCPCEMPVRLRIGYGRSPYPKPGSYFWRVTPLIIEFDCAHFWLVSPNLKECTSAG